MTHTGLLQPFEHRPALAADLLVDTFGLKLPAWGQARLTSADLSQALPTEYRADLTIVFYRDDRPVLAVVLEVQLRKDENKRYTWPVYLTTLRARLRCPAVLLVVCPRPATAAWAANVIEIGDGSVVTPLVLGPRQIPVVTDPAQASAHPELAVLSALAHGGRHPHRQRVLAAFLSAVRTLASVDQERAEIYHAVLSGALPEAARHYLERLMSTSTEQFKAQLARRHRHLGKAESRADAVLTVLEARGIPVPPAARDRIIDCTNLKRLDTWLRRAVRAESVQDLFAA